MDNLNKLPNCPDDQSAYRHLCWGTYSDANGNEYVGEFWDNKINGVGTVTYANGAKYVGEFKDDKINGQGTITNANGRILEGIFENGIFIREAKVNLLNSNKNVNGKNKNFNTDLTQQQLSQETRSFEERIPDLLAKKPTNADELHHVDNYATFYWKASLQRVAQLALIGLYNNDAVLRETQSGNKLRTWKHNNAILSVAFSPDGQQVMTGSGDRTAVIRDVKSGQILQTWTHDHLVMGVAFSPNGQQVLTGSWDGTAALRDVKSGQTIKTWKHNKQVESVAFSPDGQQVLTGSGDRTTILRDVKSGKTLQTWKHTSGFESVAFSPDGWQVLTGSSDGTVALRDVKSGNTVRSWKHNQRVSSVAFSPYGHQVLTGSWDRTAVLRDIKSGKTLQTWSHDGGGVRSVAFSPSGQQVLTGSWDGTAVLRDAKTGKTLQTWTHDASVLSVAFQPNDLTDLGSALPQEIREAEAENRALPRSLVDQQSKLEREKPTKSEFESIAQFDQRVAQWNAAAENLNTDIQRHYAKLDPLPLDKRAHAFERALSRAYGNPELHDVRYESQTGQFLATLKASLNPNFKRFVSITVPSDHAKAMKSKLASAGNDLEVELRVTDKNELIWGQLRIRLDDTIILAEYVDKDFIPPNTSGIVSDSQQKYFLPSPIARPSQDPHTAKKTYKAVVVCEQSGATPYTEDLVLTALKIYAQAGASYASGFIDTVSEWCRILKPFTVKPEELNNTALQFEKEGKHFLRGWALKGYENFWDSKGHISLPVFNIFGIVSD